MPTVRDGRASPRIGQGLRPDECQGAVVHTECGAPFRIDRSAARNREPTPHRADVRIEIGKLIGVKDSLEDVEAAARVGLEDVRMQAAVPLEPDRAAVSELEGPTPSFAQVRAPGLFFRPRRAHVDRPPGDWILHTTSGAKLSGAIDWATAYGRTSITTLPVTSRAAMARSPSATRSSGRRLETWGLSLPSAVQ